MREDRYMPVIYSLLPRIFFFLLDQQDVYQRKFFKSWMVERQSGEFFPELVHIACSCVFCHRTNNDEKRGPRTRLRAGEAVPSRTSVPDSFSL